MTRMRVDHLSARMKAYESRETQRRAMRGLPLAIRLDGRSFSRFTKPLAKPFDPLFRDLMAQTARYLIEETQAVIAYTQSDEITVILDPFSRKLASMTAARGHGPKPTLADVLETDIDFPFSGRFQKLTSVLSGMATARFMAGALDLWPEHARQSLPSFDTRVVEILNREEAVAALAHREIDARKNSISMAARTYFPASRLQNKSSAEMRAMLLGEKGIDFDSYPAIFRRGIYQQSRPVLRELDAEMLARIPAAKRPNGPVVRHVVVTLDMPPITRVTNAVEVVFEGADPITADTIAAAAAE